MPLDENAGEPPVFDPARLQTLMELEEEGDDSMIRDISMQFIEDITGILGKLETAIQTNNFAQVASAAHTIKGSSATFGLYQMEKLARSLEAAARSEDKHGAIPGLHAAIVEAFARGKEALQAYFNT